MSYLNIQHRVPVVSVGTWYIHTPCSVADIRIQGSLDLVHIYTPVKCRPESNASTKNTNNHVGTPTNLTM